MANTQSKPVLQITPASARIGRTYSRVTNLQAARNLAAEKSKLFGTTFYIMEGKECYHIDTNKAVYNGLKCIGEYTHGTRVETTEAQLECA